MSACQNIVVPSRLTVVFMFARLLEKLEHSTEAVHPDQYRFVVRQLEHEIESVVPDPALRELLGVFPAAAQVYENRFYAAAGLSHAPRELEAAAQSLAQRAIRRAQRRACASDAEEG